MYFLTKIVTRNSDLNHGHLLAGEEHSRSLSIKLVNFTSKWTSEGPVGIMAFKPNSGEEFWEIVSSLTKH